MDYVKLGRSGLRVSRLALGTVNLGWLADDEESFSVFDHAHEAGVNLFDTSDNYNAGQCEETLGRWFTQDRRRRDDVVLATKVYSPPTKWSSPDPRERTGVGVLTYSPLGTGLLAGALSGGDDARRRRGAARNLDAGRHRQIEQYEKLCAEAGHQPADVALAWVASRPGVTAPIIGPRSRAQLEGSLRALELSLDDDLAARLDELFPGPGGPAPEAYAW